MPWYAARGTASKMAAALYMTVVSAALLPKYRKVCRWLRKARLSCTGRSPKSFRRFNIPAAIVHHNAATARRYKSVLLASLATGQQHCADEADDATWCLLRQGTLKIAARIESSKHLCPNSEHLVEPDNTVCTGELRRRTALPTGPPSQTAP